VKPNTLNAVWQKIKNEHKDPLYQIILFSDIFVGTKLQAISYLKENGFEGDVKGIREIILKAVLDKSHS
jgi:hypothetical protein